MTTDLLFYLLDCTLGCFTSQADHQTSRATLTWIHRRIEVPLTGSQLCKSLVRAPGTREYMELQQTQVFPKPPVRQGIRCPSRPSSICMPFFEEPKDLGRPMQMPLGQCLDKHINRDIPSPLLPLSQLRDRTVREASAEYDPTKPSSTTGLSTSSSSSFSF